MRATKSSGFIPRERESLKRVSMVGTRRPRSSSEMSMELFDFRACGDIRQMSAPALFEGYPEPVVRGLEELGSELAASFSEAEDDLVELARV
jgi:hypothetical protein